MRTCAVCKKKINKENGTFFRVPKCEKRRQKWSAICGMTFTPNSRMCIDHFSRSQVITAGRRFMLMPNAAPVMQNQQNEVLSGLPDAYEPLINSATRDPLELPFQEYPEAADLPIKMENTYVGPFQEQQTQTDAPFCYDDVTYYRNQIKKLELENKELKYQLAQANLAVDSMRKNLTDGQIRKLKENANCLHASGPTAYKHLYDSPADVVTKPANCVQFTLLQHPVLNYDVMDHDVIVIKSEDLSEQVLGH